MRTALRARSMTLRGAPHVLQAVRARFLRLARPGDGGLWRPFQELAQDSSGFVDKRELLRAQV